MPASLFPDQQPTPFPVPRPTGHTYKLLKTKQLLWAKRSGLTLVGSAGDRGLPSYTTTVEANCPRVTEADRADFRGGQGNELDGKIRCVWSSSALVLNVFGPARSHPEVMLKALGCPTAGRWSLRLEALFPIFDFGGSPNVDVAFTEAETGRIVAIESKYCEPWSGRCSHFGQTIKAKYRQLHALWSEWPHLHRFASAPNSHVYLDSFQLLKHAVGLRYTNRPFTLVYLFVDVPGTEGYRHWQEVNEFQAVCQPAGIDFRVAVYQDLILNLPDSEHTAWLRDRYL